MNWGKGISLVIAAFILLIVGMVAYVVRQDHELVAEDYYDQELQYQDRLDYARNARESGLRPEITQSEPGCLQIAFPEAVKGKVELLRPSDKKLDSKAEFTEANGAVWQFCPRELPKGMWVVSLTWEHKGKVCYAEEKFVSGS